MWRVGYNIITYIITIYLLSIISANKLKYNCTIPSKIDGCFINIILYTEYYLKTSLKIGMCCKNVYYIAIIENITKLNF